MMGARHHLFRIYRKLIIGLTAIIVILLIFQKPSFGAPLELSQVCQDSELWNWTDAQVLPGKPWREEFAQSLTRQGSKIRGFSEAIALRRISQQPLDLAFSDYWISRMLFSIGLYHLAEQGFSTLIQRSPTPTIAPFQTAALGCINVIHRSYSAIPVSTQITSHLALLDSLNRGRPTETRAIFWESALNLIIEAKKPSQAQSSQLLAILNDAGPFENVGLALAALQSGDLKAAQVSFNKLFQPSEIDKIHALNPKWDIDLDLFRLLASRVSYELGNYSEAIQYDLKINSKSNFRIQALSELSWAYLMLGKYREAIGTSLTLQSGPLRQTFAPEATMVMAMALNEMCRFPESMGAIQSFKKKYRDLYFWLKNRIANFSEAETYRQLIAFARRQPHSQIPAIIGTEWIRSPRFIADQERINLSFQEKHQLDLFSQKGKTEQRLATLQLISEARKLRLRAKEMSQNATLRESAQAEFLRSFGQLRENLVHLKRLRTGSVYWRKIVKSNESRGHTLREAMNREISLEVHHLNQRMLSQLEEIAENQDLIEVEILNGASEDLVWRNAHPNFQALSARINSQDKTTETNTTWNWGSTKIGAEESGEIWEDEIGSFSADLSDQCENKDKYLQIKAQEARGKNE